MQRGMAEDEPFHTLRSPLAPLSAISSGLGFCFLASTQPFWLPAQKGEGEGALLQLLSENNPTGTAQEQDVPKSVSTSVLMSSSPCCELCLCPTYPQSRDLCGGRLGGLQGLCSCLRGLVW